MDKKQHRAVIALYSADVFLDTYREHIPRTIQSGAYARFTETLARLNLHIQTQASAPLMAKGLTNAKDVKREALLRDHLRPLVRIARMERRRAPELAAFKLLRGEPGIHKLLGHARGLAISAESHRELFIQAGLKPTFREDLIAAVDDILATIADRTTTQGSHSGSTKGIEEAIRECSDARSVLDSFVRSELHGRRDLLVTWQIMKRVGPVSGPSHKSLERQVPIANAAPALPADRLEQDQSHLLPAPLRRLTSGVVHETIDDAEAGH